MEKTVSEADDLAAQIRADAEQKAQDHAKEVLAEAEEKARQVLEEARAKAVAETENEVRAIKENAERALEGTLGEHAARWQEQVKQAAERLYEQMLAQAEEAKRRLEAFQGDLARLAGSVRVSSDQPVAPAVETVPEPALDEVPEPKSVFEPAKAAEVAETKAESTAPVRYAKGQEELVDIVILPPRDKQAMESIRKFLERQEEVAAVNVEHMTDRTLIQVLLAQPLNVAERLSGLSEVERLQTVSDDAKTKIQVVLSVHSEIERERDRLDFRANRIASKISRATD